MLCITNILFLEECDAYKMCISMLAVKWAVFVAWHLFDMFRTPELQPWIELGSVWNQRLNMMQWQKKSLLVQITLTVLWA